MTNHKVNKALSELEQLIDNPEIMVELFLKNPQTYERARVKYYINQIKKKYGVKK